MCFRTFLNEGRKREIERDDPKKLFLQEPLWGEAKTRQRGSDRQQHTKSLPCIWERSCSEGMRTKHPLPCQGLLFSVLIEDAVLERGVPSLHMHLMV